jgi:DNA-directed RNA polymerase-4 subunit 1
MVGDPKIRLHEIGISMDLASNLVVSKHVNSYNIESINLKCNLHLRAKEILFTRLNVELIYVKKENQLKIGDIVYMSLQDGDINRD